MDGRRAAVQPDRLFRPLEHRVASGALPRRQLAATLSALAESEFRDVQLWADGRQRANLVLARPSGIAVDEPSYLVSNLDPTLDLLWAYGQRFCCEQLFRDQKAGIFQLESSGLRDPARIDRLLLVVAIAVLASSLQGYAVSLAGERRRVDPHWQRGLSFVRIGLQWLQQAVVHAGRTLLALIPIPLRELELCIPSRGVQKRQKQPWFTRIDLPPRPRQCQSQLLAFA